MQGLAGLQGYERLDGGIPVVHPPGMEERATELRSRLEAGTSSLSEILEVEPPELEALLGAAAVERFGDGFLRTLAHALWEEREVVGEERAEELLAEALGPGGRAWLESRPEFQER